MVRWEVEARLLAGQDGESIAARCDIPASVVQAYHDTFYDVRSALKADMYILCEVIGWRFWPLVSPDDHQKLLKVFGYDFGEHGVNAYLAYLREPPHVPAALELLGPDELRSLQDRLQTRLLVLLTTTPVEALSPLTWLEMYYRRRAARAIAQADGSAPATALGSIHETQAMLTLVAEGKLNNEPAKPGDAAFSPAERLGGASPRCAGPAA
jgi:hypothetical protein